MERIEEVFIVFGFSRSKRYDEIMTTVVKEKLIPELLLHPDTFIITSGGVIDSIHMITEAQQLKDLLIEIGIPPDKIIVEEKSIDAAGNIEEVAKLVKYFWGKTFIPRVIFIGEAAREKETIYYTERVFKRLGIGVGIFEYWPLYLLPPAKRLAREKKGKWIKHWITRRLWRIYRFLLLKIRREV